MADSVVNLTIDGMPVSVPPGTLGSEAGGCAGPALLLPPGAAGGRRVPHVSRAGRESPEAADRLCHSGERGNGGTHAVRAGEERTHGSARAAPHQPPARLPDL